MPTKIQKENLRKIIQTHLKNITGRGVECGIFGFFSKEKDGRFYHRCVLDNIKPLERNKPYFTPEEAKKICPYRDGRLRTKCKYPHNPNQDKKTDFDIVVGENQLLKEEISGLISKLGQADEEVRRLTERLKEYENK